MGLPAKSLGREKVGTKAKQCNESAARVSVRACVCVFVREVIMVLLGGAVCKVAHHFLIIAMATCLAGCLLDGDVFVFLQDTKLFKDVGITGGVTEVTITKVCDL